MLENTPFWETGDMYLFLNNEPTHAYVPPGDVMNLYNLAMNRISDDGKIPIGIDHLPEDVINSNPILKKLDLLDVGYITAVECIPDKEVRIKEATLTNPLIKELYLNGELEAVSIVSQASVTDCPNDEGLKVINTERLDRVDIVAKGACETCIIPKPEDGSNMVYARKPLKEENEMVNEDLTIEQIEELFETKLDEKLDEILDEKLEPITQRIEALENPEQDEEAENEGSDEKVEARLAKLEKEAEEARELARIEAANAKVDIAIRAGKIKPADRETMVAFAKSASEEFDNYIKNAAVIVPLGARQSLNSGEETETEDTEPDLIDEVNAAFAKE